MLDKIVLENFRCFRDHTVPFRSRTIIVGKNNAGKSTIVEGLRLIWLAVDRYRSVQYTPPPRWLDLHKSVRGITPSLDNQAFNFEKVFHQYNPPPARVTGHFTDRATVSVYVGPDNSIYAVFRDKRGNVAKSRSEVERMKFPRLGILHQVAPVRSTERIIDEDRVRRCLNSSLTPIQFRNQLRLFREQYFEEFKEIAEATWHGLQVQELREERDGDGRRILQLLVRNEDFVADLSWMGHGLQMWLQAMWFVARTREYSTVILDEPDVYMHADLQRKLIRLLRNRYPQVVIATHSIEIMDEVDPEEILIVDRDKREARFATDRPEVQQVINFIGGVHNVQLSRLVHTKRFLFVEGKDGDILKRIQDALFPESEFPLRSLPTIPVGGWGGWDRVIGSQFFLQKTLTDVKVYCVLDSDYFTPEQLAQKRQEAAQAGIRLKIWNRKEIENYLLVPAAIARAVARSGRKRIPTTEEITDQICAIADRMRNDAVLNIAGEIQKSNARLGIKSVMQQAERIIGQRWNTFDGKLERISGKAVLSDLNAWLSTYKISITPAGIASLLAQEEIDDDLRDFFERFEYGDEF